MAATAPALLSARRLQLLIGLPAVAACVVMALGVADNELAVPVGAWLSGLTGIVGGALVVRRAWPLTRSEAFRLLIGAAAVIWGIGQLVHGVLLLGDATYPTPGDVISAMAGPVAIAGLAMFPRRLVEPLAGLRLTCDSLVAGGVAAALVWRVGFEGHVDPGSGPGATSIGIILVELSVVALVFIAALRELDRGMVTGAAGVLIFIAGDVYTQHVVVEPGEQWPWAGMALSCLGWPLVCWGLLRISAQPPDLLDRERPVAEHRRTVVAGVVVAVILGGLLATMVDRREVDQVTVVLLAISFLAAGVRDVVVARQAKDLLTRVSDLAYVDALTGLANRRALVETLQSHGGSCAWLLTVDLDNFKTVNGLLGHAAGDRLLASAAEGLMSAVDDPADVFRLGGDEFAVLVHGGQEVAERTAGRLLGELRVAARRVPGVGRVALSASVGMARLSTPHDPLRALAESATALQVAKSEGRDRTVTYAGQVAAEAERRGHVERRLRGAIDRHEVTLNAQPVVRLESGTVCGLELLARWTDEELGRVGPLEFIDVAERGSLIVALGDQLIDIAVDAAVRHRLTERDVTFGVNVSPVQLRVPGFADRLLSRLARAGVPPDRMVLEVTEQICVSEADPAIQQIAAAAAGGVNIAIDDFGSGSASLGYLRRMPARILKLDGGLVSSMLSDARAAAIVTAVSRLGAETGMDVVAEGIEDAATAEACRAAGIVYGQGWYYARDVALDELGRLLPWCDAVDGPTLTPARPGAGRDHGSGRLPDRRSPARTLPAPREPQGQTW